jgi:hypothetical protein
MTPITHIQHDAQETFHETKCDLQPCPFCGNVPLGVLKVGKTFSILCAQDDCLATVEVEGYSVDQVSWKWNHRTGTPCRAMEDKRVLTNEEKQVMLSHLPPDTQAQMEDESKKSCFLIDPTYQELEDSGLFPDPFLRWLKAMWVGGIEHRTTSVRIGSMRLEISDEKLPNGSSEFEVRFNPRFGITDTQRDVLFKAIQLHHDGHSPEEIDRILD